MWERLRAIEARYEELTQEMARPEVSADYMRLQELARERSAIELVVELYRRARAVEEELAEARALAEGGDADLSALAREEMATLEPELEGLVESLKVALLPKDPRDERDVIVEIRAAAGGDEAALFAADLYRMYTRYAERLRWKTELVSVSESGGGGGLKEVIFGVHGQGAYSRLKYESGVHRVQRVPETEAQGRIHTSTATVAVLPEVEDVDVQISDSDLRIDIFHSGGAGGQNVNKVATAVRLTHLPSGIVVVCQDERSQLKNRTKAMSVLRARVWDLELGKQQGEIAEARRSQVGSGDRSEKIRTYNYPQDRITDHRVAGLTVHNLPGVLDGDLDTLIEAVTTAEQTRLLQESLA